MESTAQRTSRIYSEDSSAHSAYDHARDFFAGLATYSITPSLGGFSVKQITPSNQLSSFARTIEDAHQQIEEMKNKTVCVGYSKQIFGE